MTVDPSHQAKRCHTGPTLGRRTLDCAQAGETAGLGGSLVSSGRSVLELSEACYAQGGTEVQG